MSKLSNSALDDFSVVHRLCFAARVLPIGSPNYWENIADFSIMGKNGYSLIGNETKIFVENLKYLNPAVFDDDATLTKELVRMPKMNTKDPEKIGLILISPIECCVLCGSKLSVRQDRSAQAISYMMITMEHCLPFTLPDTAEKRLFITAALWLLHTRRQQYSDIQ